MKKLTKIETSIKNILETIPSKARSSNWTSDRQWTDEIRNRLRKLGKDNGFMVCGHTRENPGWLYDMTWLLYRGDRLIDVPLVLESEWNPRGIDDDFQKLLIARAKHRVMIFQQKSIDDVKIKMDDFEKQILKFNRTYPDDRYFFAGLDWNTGIFEFRLFIPGKISVD